MVRWILLIFIFCTGQALAGLNIDKQPAKILRHTFVPGHSPSAMPKLTPPENAVTECTLLIDAGVGGQYQQVAIDRANISVTNINIKLNMNIDVWDPKNALQSVIDHEEGHRQISEEFYVGADLAAKKIASAYIGKTFNVAVTEKTLKKVVDAKYNEISLEIIRQFNQRIPMEVTQNRYDAITNHSLNDDIMVTDAITQAFKETYIKPQ